MTKLTITLILILSAFVACSSESEAPPSTGNIFLFGEIHGSAITMNRQLEIWGEFYNDYGMRHLFYELPYFTAQFLNMWMQSDDDVILYQLFEDWQGTWLGVPPTRDFFKTIKRDFPETIFHGTDVGFQYYSTGERFLQYLIDNNLQDTESYRLTRENIEQHMYLVKNSWNFAIRAHYKPLNFIREFDQLVNQDVMAIHGGMHVVIGGRMGHPGTEIPNMATTLFDRYGDALQTFNMVRYGLLDVRPVYPSEPIQRQEPLHVETVTIDGVEFEASFFGSDGILFPTTQRVYWRLENAYDFFQNHSLTGYTFPLDYFPTHVEVGQVFVVATQWFIQGTVQKQFYRIRCEYEQNGLSAHEFIVEL